MDTTAQPSPSGATTAAPTLDDASDEALARRAQAGEESAFRDLLRRHGAVLRRTAMRRTRNTADADDVVQEAALRAWRHLPQLREPAAVRTWMLQITEREAVRWAVARRQEHALTEDAVLVSGPDAQIDRFDLHEGLRAAFRALPDHLAQAWVLREADGFSYREIADRLAVRESTVRGWLATARKHVQRVIDDCCPSARPASPGSAFALGEVAAPLAPPVKAPVATYPPSAVTGPVAGVRTPLHQERGFEQDVQPLDLLSPQD